MSEDFQTQLGRTIGEHFKIIDLLGRGGMATVFKGTDLRTNETVAIKLLKPEVIQIDAGLVDRFEREGEALRRLNHPNIVKMLGAVSEGDHHYVIMDYVAGGDLRQLLKKYRKNNDLMPIDRLLNIALDLSDALTRAHRLNIVHRDIKPANVLIAEDGTPRLTDFGVAHFSDSTRVTQTGTMVGTLAYLSPEACLGKSVDARADIWAFGVMLYEMLALQQPFKEANTAALLTAIMTKEPQISIEKIREDAPLTLITLVREMLIKQREDRISSVRLVGARLEAIISGNNMVGEGDGIHTPAVAMTSSELDDIKSAVSEHLEGDTSLSVSGTPSTPTPLPSLTASEAYSVSTPTSSRSDWTLPPIRRRLERRPRVFLSYMPTDSPTFAGRIHDRLSLRFGENNLIKDVETNSLGMDFHQAIENEVNNSDVMLIVMGKNWANYSTLEDTNNPIRLQLDAGLKRDNYLMIPLLVEGATMPTSDQLPESLRGLLQRRSAVIRDEPHFTNDTAWIANQIEQAFRANEPQRKLQYWWIGAALLAVILVIGVLAVLTGGGDSESDNDDEGADNNTVIIEDTTEATSNLPVIQTVSPVRDGDYMVLIIPFDRIGDIEDEASEFIREDLTQRLERDAPNSNISVRVYPEPATSLEHLAAIVEQNQPALVVTGRYDGELTEVTLSAGALAQFPYNVLEQDLIDEVVSVGLEMTNVRTQTIALNVLAGLSALYLADGDMFELGRINVMVDTLSDSISEEAFATISDASIATHWHRSFIIRHSDSEGAIEALEEAIDLNVRNPLLYSARGLVYQITRDFDEASDDFGTASALAPDGWTFSAYANAIQTLLTNFNPADARGAFDEIVLLRPDDWFAFSFKGTINYILGDLPSADEDVRQSLDLNPEANFPYPFAFGIAIRQGRLADAQIYMEEVLERFPDPTYGYEMLDSSFGVEEDNPFTIILEAFGNFALRQWQQVIEVGERFANANLLLPLSDVNMMQGVAYCNLTEPDWESAVQAYTNAYDRDPEFAFTLLLRAEAHIALSEPQMAIDDIQMVITHRQAARYVPYMRAFRQGEINCSNFLRVNLEDLVDPNAPVVLPPPQLGQGSPGGQGQPPPRQQGQGNPPGQQGNQSGLDQAEIDDFMDELFPEIDESSAPLPKSTE